MIWFFSKCIEITPLTSMASHVYRTTIWETCQIPMAFVYRTFSDCGLPINVIAIFHHPEVSTSHDQTTTTRYVCTGMFSYNECF